MDEITKVIVPHLPTREDAATKKRVPSINLNPARRFGELVVLYDGPIASDDMQDAVDTALDRLICNRLMEPTDYIVCVGDPVLTAAVMSKVSDLYGFVKTLRWDRLREQYDVVRVEL